MNPSPHRSDSHPVLQQSRMDNNLSVLRESREIGLVSGLSGPPSGSHPTAPPPLKDDPRALSAAFQPYHHPPRPSSSSNATPPSHPPGTMMQIPPSHPSHMPPSGPSHQQGPPMHPSQGPIMSELASLSAPVVPVSNSEMESYVKKEPITVEDDTGSDDDMRGGSLTPGPTNPCTREIYKSNSAM